MEVRCGCCWEMVVRREVGFIERLEIKGCYIYFRVINRYIRDGFII